MTTRTERPAASSGAAGHAPYTRDRRSRRTTYGTGVALFLSCVGGATGMFAQEPGTGSYAPGDAVPPAYRSSADSLASMKVRAEAAVARGLHVEVSLLDRMVWVIREGDTLVRAEAAVASGMTIEFAGRSWTFRTPRGRHSVLRKLEQPVWTPPDWLYAEAALEHGLELEPLSPGANVPLRDGLHLVVRENRVGVLNDASGRVDLLPVDEHVVFDGTLYIPPVGTLNRMIHGELGRYALDLGDGYLIHGTPDPSSIGRAVTHGCIRLGDRDITWLYRHVPVGTPVYIY